MNEILKYGVVTPCILFHFSNGDKIESNPKNPRYFMSFEHTRTCKKACTFKLVITYVPDTFTPGEPTLLDNIILSSVNQKVSYRYGYYDYLGQPRLQKQFYTGQVYTYNSNINIDSGTLEYTIEGTATVSELNNLLDYIPGLEFPTNKLGKFLKLNKVKPSVYLSWLTTEPKSSGFTALVNAYKIDTSDHEDESVYIPRIETAPVLDLIMGKVVDGSSNASGIPTRTGGLVQFAKKPLPERLKKCYNLVQSVLEGKTQINSASDERLFKQAKLTISEMESTLVTSYTAFIDDVETEGKFGTLYFKKSEGLATNNVFEYDLGNDVRNSDVLSFSVTYNGANAMAAVRSSDNVTASIDAEGNNIGHSVAITEVSNLGKNTFPTLSGFDEDSSVSKTILSDIMLYPYEADLDILGQIEPSNLLDLIYVVVKINGTEHPTLTGEYKVLEISDTVNSQGFTTRLHLIREVSNRNNSVYNPVTEKYVTNPTENSKARQTEAAITASTGTSSNDPYVANT